MDFYMDRACPGGACIGRRAENAGYKDIGHSLKEALQAILEAFFNGCFHEKYPFQYLLCLFLQFLHASACVIGADERCSTVSSCAM